MIWTGEKRREQARRGERGEKIASYLPWKARTRREEARNGEKRRDEARRSEKRREEARTAERGENTEIFNNRKYGVNRFLPEFDSDRKSTRLNSSHAT